MVTGGQSLKKFHELACQDCSPIRLSFFVMIFASSHFVLSHLPNFNSISGVSLVAAVMSLRYTCHLLFFFFLGKKVYLSSYVRIIRENHET